MTGSRVSRSFALSTLALVVLGVVLGRPRLALASGAGRIAYLAAGSPYWQVWVMDASGERPRQLTRSGYEKSHVAWYPDGRRLLVTALDGSLAAVDVESGAESPLELGADGLTDAVLSPKGDRLAYAYASAGKGDTSEIWVTELVDGSRRRLTRLPGLQHQPDWAPSGDWIYFSSEKDPREINLWRVSIRSGAEEKLTSHGLYSLEVAAGPDGRVAYSGNQTGDYEIWIWQPESGVPPRQLTHDPALDGAPAWGPDGRDLAFHSTRSGTLQIWRIPAAGGKAAQLTNHPGGARAPAWWFSKGTPE